MASSIEAKVKVARVFRAARKLRGYRQDKLSKLIDNTQGTVSKIENATLIPDTAEWYLFCEKMNIDPDQTFSTGYVISRTPIVNNSNFKVGKFKKVTCYVKVSSCIPFLLAIRELGYEDEFFPLLKKSKIDRDVFVVINYEVPINVLQMMVDFLKSKIELKKTVAIVSKCFSQEYDKLIGNLNLGNLHELITAFSVDEPYLNFEMIGNDISITLKPGLEEDTFSADYIMFKANFFNEVIKLGPLGKRASLQKSDSSLGYNVTLS
tara:strand:+ start:115074 stop:115865 length:792 start_codon:yes stop_codon:yes gene_type:complete